MSRNTLRHRCLDDQGLTLVELLIAVVLVALITGAIAAGVVTSIRGTSSIGQKVRESNDAELISTFLVRDAQAAGGIDPTTGSTDPTLGVSTTDPAGCTGVGLRVRFKWNDRPAGTVVPITNVVTYTYDALTTQFTRTFCSSGGTNSSLVLGRQVQSVSVNCTPGGGLCPTLPSVVALTLTATNAPATGVTPFTYTLTANVRPQGKTSPTSLTAKLTPLIALGGATDCAAGATGLDMTGNANITVNGQALIDDKGIAGCPAMAASGSASYSATSTSILNGGTCTGNKCPGTIGTYTTPLDDPLAAYASSCTGGTNPTPSGNPSTFTPGAGGVLVFPRNWTPGPGTYNFNAGLYVFCGSVSLAGNVFVNGTNAIFYVPNSLLTLTGNSNTLNLQSLIARTIYFTGASSVALGPSGTLAIGTTSLPDGWQDNPYSTTASATGGTSPYTWSATGLPTGLTINPGTGTISGTPSTAGSSSVNLTVRDAAGTTKSRTMSLRINPPAVPPSITAPSSLPSGTSGVVYPNTTFTATSGTVPYAWSASGLPLGLTLNATGVLSGTPTTSNSFTVVVTVTDAASATAARSYSLTIASGPLVISGPSVLPASTVNRSYTVTVTAAGGAAGPYTWAASGLPAGLAMTAATGVITGTPTVSGTSSVTARVTDSSGASVSRGYSLVINPAPSITNTSLPATTLGRAYSAPLAATGGTPPYIWAIVTQPLGGWLSINSTTGVLSGTPNATGTSNVDIGLTDAAGAAVVKTLSLTINPAVSITAPATFPHALTGSIYPSQTLTATGGTGTLTWSATGLPPGVTFASSNPTTVSGTPTAAGTFAMTLTATDAIGATATRTYSFNVISVSPSPITVPKNQNVNVTLTASGGTAPYTWAIVTQPAGAWAGITLSLSAGGVLTSSTPSPTGANKSATLSISVTDAAGAAATGTVTITT